MPRRLIESAQVTVPEARRARRAALPWWLCRVWERSGTGGLQASLALPDWQTSWRQFTADGKAADLTHVSTANQTRDFPRPSSRLPASALGQKAAIP